MKKLLISAAMAAMFGAMVSPAQAAGTASNAFNVSVTLSSQCTQLNSGTQTVDFGTYIAFGAAVTTAPRNLTFTCTRGFAPVGVTFDAPAYGLVTGEGVIQGLQYALTAAAPTSVAGTAATPLIIGTGDTVTYAVTGFMQAAQAGNCAGATCGPTTHVRNLILTY